MSDYNSDLYIDHLKRRIKELEKDRDFWAEMAKEYKDSYNELLRRHDGRQYITDEQIDVAAIQANHDLDAWEDSTTWTALNDLGIERCENCLGTGHLEEEDIGECCPNCNGKGWIKV